MDKPMTKQRLERYTKLRDEIEMLEIQIAKGADREELLADVVRGSTGPGYTMGRVVIRGYGSRSFPKLRQRLAEKIAECEAIEQFVLSVEDTVMWQLLTYRYIEGESLRKTATKMNLAENSVSRLINDFFGGTGDNVEPC